MEARRLHDEAIVVDTHNDLILLIDHNDRRHRRQNFGEFWLPQLRAGGVNVQVLPICIEEQFQSEGALRRTLLLVERLYEIAAQHRDDVEICGTAEDIDRAVSAGRIALVLALEGAHAIGQDPALIRTMERVGIRVVSMAHFGRTFLADGSGLDGTSRGRLTPQGIQVFQEMERLGVVFDISHLGVGGMDDVLSLATRPFLATHSACRAIAETHRNLTDSQLRGIAALGGVVSVAAAIPQFIDVDDPSVVRVVDHIEHLIDVIGADHIGIGPDFIDDYVRAEFGEWPQVAGVEFSDHHAEIARPADLPKITEEMISRGFPEADIRGILGENVMRVLREVMGIPQSAAR
ncbi:dipeptidase [Rhodococcus wratislaviensis]|uniref:Peptidase M19 family protein n=1 Tax=Rhodococcus wratislaviensis NBRC 100605 TaxID=1219028 RepID=X0PW79_RHOWR|nr:membrane dipeptidase [Rhodococcus wratislaviensis]GAF47523.1 peptidase M19 family protein [Rhodococcus wratislaviensis NBRC 100605]